MATIGRRFAFENPFRRNHCVVHSWTHLAGGDAAAAQALATTARLQRRLSPHGVCYGTERHTHWWAQAVGLQVVREERLFRGAQAYAAGKVLVDGREWTVVRSMPTLATFARQHSRGKFLVLVRGHAVAVINGQIFGTWRPRSQVRYYAEVV